MLRVYKWLNRSLTFLLEIILLQLVIITKEWDCVGHHPDVSSSTIIVGLVPLSIFITNCKNLFFFHVNIGGVDDLLVESCKRWTLKSICKKMAQGDFIEVNRILKQENKNIFEKNWKFFYRQKEAEGTICILRTENMEFTVELEPYCLEPWKKLNF